MPTVSLALPPVPACCPQHPAPSTCTCTEQARAPFSTAPRTGQLSPGGKYPFRPNFLQPLCNHLNLLPNLPILRAVQNFPRHDNSPSSSHLVLFHSILLTPTAIALSSLHEGLIPTAHHSPRPNSFRAACPFLVRPFSPSSLAPLPPSSMRRRRQSLLLLPGFCLLPHRHLYMSASPCISLELIPFPASIAGLAH